MQTDDLQPLDLDQPFTADSRCQAYLDFYQLNFAAQMEHVNHQMGYIDSHPYKIACHYFSVQEPIKTCFIIHGYMDHSGLYYKIIDHLLQKNINVVAADLPGHGLSSGAQATINDFSTYYKTLRDVFHVFSQAVAQPCCLIGQSMGGAIVMDYLLQIPPREAKLSFSEVVLLAPLVRPKGWLGIRFAHALLASFTSSIKRNFSVNSHDKVFLDFLKYQDPFQTKRLSVQWVGAMLAWQKRFHQLTPSPINLTVVQGDDDQTVDWRFNVKAIARQFPNAAFCMIKDGRHHLAGENGVYFEQVLKAIDQHF